MSRLNILIVELVVIIVGFSGFVAFRPQADKPALTFVNGSGNGSISQAGFSELQPALNVNAAVNSGGLTIDQ